MMTDSQVHTFAWKQALDLCRELGIKTAERKISEEHPYTWDGKCLSILAWGNVYAGSVINLWHEIAHWLVASPERRKAVDYGLGGSFESEKESPLLVKDLSDAQKEENNASVLGCLLLAAFGFESLARINYYSHSWHTWNPEFDSLTRNLLKMLPTLGLNAPKISYSKVKHIVQKDLSKGPNP